MTLGRLLGRVGLLHLMLTVPENNSARKGRSAPDGAQLNAVAAFAPVEGKWSAVIAHGIATLRTGKSTLHPSARTSESALVTVNPEKGSPVYASPRARAGSNPYWRSTTQERPQRADSIPSASKALSNRHHLVS